MKAAFVRNSVFGFEDGLVSTVGLLSGIAAAGVDKSTIFLTGVVLIFVEAFSMGVGSMLSDHEGKEFEEHREVPISRSYMGGAVMFFSYLIAGFLPLLPYVFLEAVTAIWVSVALSLAALFVLGITAARMARIPLLKQGMQMALMGGLAIILGIAVGQLLK